jgi:hypothetical protein
MFRKNPHEGEVSALDDLRFTDPSVPSRSCCCPARPVVKVIIPPAERRAQPMDLWLCGHHYRASLAALLTSGATVEDLTLTYGPALADHAAAAA